MRATLITTLCATLALGNDLRGHLVGFEGCKNSQKSFIADAWRDARGVMDLIRNITIDWNEAAALEFLGPPAYTIKRQGDIQAILNNLGTVTESAISDWQIHVRCDDHRKVCAPSKRVAAYVFQQWAGGSESMNFCPLFFGMEGLGPRIEAGKKSSNPEIKANLNRYSKTTGTFILHELLHVQWVSMSGKYGTNSPVDDLTIKFSDPGNPLVKLERKVYGPLNAKILARSSLPDCLGDFIVRSDENLMLYALAKYVQQELGLYPHLPLVNTQPVTRPSYPKHWIYRLFEYLFRTASEFDHNSSCNGTHSLTLGVK